MIKNIRLWLIGALAFIAAIVFHITINSGKEYDNKAIPEFIIGTWEFQYSLPTSDYVVRELDFVDSNTVVADIDFPGGRYYNVIFQYEFIGRDKIEIAGRLSDEWQIERNGDFLVIRSTSWPGSSRIIVYKRIVPFNWLLITMTIGVCVAGSLVAFFAVSQQTLATNVFFKDSSFSTKIKRIAGYSFALALGVLTGILIWSWPPLLRVRLPWDSIIMFELSILILLTGAVLIRGNYVILKKLMPSIEKRQAVIGFLLSGLGICGIGISLVKLTFYVIYKSYPT